MSTTRRFYYFLKPYVPWRARMSVRRLFAARVRKANSAVWPIDSASATVPEKWSGWPNGKKFPFIITHDVEGPEGLAKCRRLAEFEMERGFRSSFNFIPEGPYDASKELRDWLTENGFEVGVHDLAHDGKLFDSRRGFRLKAERINHYVKEWGAAGFRAGFMLRQLEWMRDLAIQYDASTFDTDPFEPMSDGAKTIFPFWISRGGEEIAGTVNGRAPDEPDRFLELPYTLPQDSTLFLLLKEASPEIWIKKLDWVANHGGMALVNVHPDYIRFEGEAASARKFPIKFYGELLDHVQSSFAETCWRALPRDLAKFMYSLPRSDVTRSTAGARSRH